METKPSQSDKVNEYMKDFKHPQKNIVEALREFIMSIDKEIGEEVKWNSPSYFYSGPMEPTDPKLYKRYLAVTNAHKQDHIMLVLPNGMYVDDGSGFLEGKFTDGRRVVKFYSIEDVENKKNDLKNVIKKLLGNMN